ncbi:hypothetical protein [Holospora undulata]|uniref:Uncharacterized protein n=1 Tax=Holospora undulata HU1 TaxID=1321371 RepID=A0A061JG52_9PROT|nr:hypothetical protein [Holospora undulata]ETZ04896.1 hypothetical protein K737_300691 [Holospora undulata HU1]
MTKSYSNDLRQKGIEYLDEGGAGILVSAIGRWHRKYRQEGSYFPKKCGGSEKKIDLEKLEENVQKLGQKK